MICAGKSYLTVTNIWDKRYVHKDVKQNLQQTAYRGNCYPTKISDFVPSRRYANMKYFLWKKKFSICVTKSLYESVKSLKSRNGLIHFIHHTKGPIGPCTADRIQASVLHLPFPINITSLNNSTQKRHPGSWICGERMKYRLSNLLLEGGIAILSVTLTLRLLMSYTYGAPILDVSRSHTTTHHSR